MQTITMMTNYYKLYTFVSLSLFSLQLSKTHNYYYTYLGERVKLTMVTFVDTSGV